MLVYLIRHGQTEMNEKGVGNWQIDDKLSEIGKQQALLLAQKCSILHFDNIWASDLSRAYETAQVIADWQNYSITVQKDKRLRERSFGEFEWQPLYILKNKAIAAGYQTSSDYFHLEKSIEWWPEMICRYEEWFDTAIDLIGSKNIAIVSHWGMIREIVSNIMTRYNWDYFSRMAPIVNTSITIIEITQDKKKILTFNDYSHLRALNNV